MPSTGNRYSLDKVFDHSTESCQISIKWTCIGNTSNPPVVFIHGTPWSSVTWHDLASALESRYCVYLYDHPGFESSPQLQNHDGTAPGLDPTLKLRAAASAALIKFWDLKQKPHVIAHDNGGLVSLRLFLEHNLKFASLTLIDVVAIGPFGSDFFNLVANNHEVFTGLPSNFKEGFVRSYIRSACHTNIDSSTEDMLAKQWLEGGSQGPERFLQEMLQAHNRNLTGIEQRYAEVGTQIPVKIVWGKEDSWLPVARAQKLADALKAQEVVVVEGAAHLIHYDQPGRLAFELGYWLSQFKR